MNKKIKVIELYQKLAKQENMPDKIKYNNDIYYLCIDSLENVFYYETNKGFQLMITINSVQTLNREVEILEDKEETGISKLEKEEALEENPAEFGYYLRYYYDKEKMGDKINEIIKKVNELDKKINKENKNA